MKPDPKQVAQLTESDKKLTQAADSATKHIREFEAALQSIDARFTCWSNQVGNRVVDDNGQSWTLGWRSSPGGVFRLYVQDEDGGAGGLLADAPRLIRILAANKLEDFLGEMSDRAQKQISMIPVPKKPGTYYDPKDKR